MTPARTDARKELVELADVCEKATGPDRGIELAIWRIVDPRAPEIEADGRAPLPWLHCYTASLDAALSLVPELAITSLAKQERWRKPTWTWGLNDGKGGTHFGFSATPALALCAAALKARALAAPMTEGEG